MPALQLPRDWIDASTAIPDTNSFGNTKKSNQPSAGTMVRSVLLLLTAASSAAVSVGGVSVLGYLLATHALTPRHLEYSVHLPLDLNEQGFVAEASVLPNAAANNAAAHVRPPKSADLPQQDGRLLPPGQSVDVFLDLEVPGSLPSSRPGIRSELAHVVAELRSTDGRPASRATQPVLLRGRPASFTGMFLAPLRWIGILDDKHIVPIKIFNNYQEQNDIPFSLVHVAIKSRNGAGPDILKAKARVRLRVNFLRKLLYYLRPHSLLALLLGIGAASAALGGAGVAAVAIAMLALAVLRPRLSGLAESSDESSGSEDEGLTELLAGTDSAAVPTPRDLSGFERELEEEDTNKGEIEAVHESEEEQKAETEVTEGEGDTLIEGDGVPVPSPTSSRPWANFVSRLPLSNLASPREVFDDTAYGSETAGTSSQHGLRWRKTKTTQPIS